VRLTLIVLATFSLGATLAAADFTGTWKLNVEKSKLPADLASETMTISQTGPNSYKSSIDMVTKSGERRHTELNRTCDGREHLLTGVGIRQEKGASEICQQIDPSTRKVTAKRGGKVIEEITSTLSPDGKVATVDIRRTLGNTEEILVFNRH
jgi:hypothetical protein